MESPALLPTHSFQQDLEGFHSSCLHRISKAFQLNNLIRNSGGTANKAWPSPNRPRAPQGRNVGGIPSCPHRPCPFSATARGSGPGSC